MSSEIYEVLSLAARYWFTFLGVLIVWRAFRWLRKDRRAKHRRLKQLPDAGMIGEWVVLSGSRALPAGTTLPVPREGELGSLRVCDVTIPVPGVAPRHLDFVFRAGKGLLIYPRRGCIAQADNVEITDRSPAKEHPLYHGSRLWVGEAELRLRLFEGLETGRRTPAPEAPAEHPAEAAESAWQETPYIYHQIPADWLDQTTPYLPEDWPVDPETGLPLEPMPYDPITGLPLEPAPFDPATGLPLESALYDPVTGLPLEPMPFDPAAGTSFHSEPFKPVTEQTATDTFERAAARDRCKFHPRRGRHGKK